MANILLSTHKLTITLLNHHKVKFNLPINIKKLFNNLFNKLLL